MYKVGDIVEVISNKFTGQRFGEHFFEIGSLIIISHVYESQGSVYAYGKNKRDEHVGLQQLDFRDIRPYERKSSLYASSLYY